MTDAFERPGPGGWKRLGDHFPGPLTAEYQQLYAETCPPGMASYMARYGVLARGLDVAFVHGHLYITPIPLAGPREMRRPPPWLLVWLMSRVHPTFRRRTRAAKQALVQRPWLDAAAHWFGNERFGWIERNRALEDVDPSTLNDRDQRAHLLSCRTHAAAGYQRHFELHGDDLLPVGLLLARCAEWDIEPATATRALSGATPARLLDGGQGAWQLISGYDLDSLARCELDSRPAVEPATAAQPFDLSPLVPVEDHEELERLVADARTVVPLRDDNGLHTGAWPMGLLRRAMLETGRRIGLHDAEHAVELTVDELEGRLLGQTTPSADDAAERRRVRTADSARFAPPTLGPDFAVPPLSALPRALALIGAAQLAAADNMTERDAAPLGIGDRSYTGRALVVDDPGEAFELVEPGDVIITTATSPSWVALIGLAGALVTTTGGVLSHAAVLAREFGIPAVIGDRTARQRITTGRLVTVDPARGSVTDEAERSEEQDALRRRHRR